MKILYLEDGVRCDALRCDAMRCDALRCHTLRWVELPSGVRKRIHVRARKGQTHKRGRYDSRTSLTSGWFHSSLNCCADLPPLEPSEAMLESDGPWEALTLMFAVLGLIPIEVEDPLSGLVTLWARRVAYECRCSCS